MTLVAIRRRLTPLAGSGVAALLLVACGSDDPVGNAAAADTESGIEQAAGGELSGNIAGAGASAQEAAAVAWIAGFQADNPDVTVTYDPIGSGGGRSQFLSGGVAFAGSDAVLDDEELAQSRDVCGPDGAIDLPLYISPIAVIYHLEGVDEQLRLSPETIAGIFNQEITNWNDPAIAETNEGVELPDLAINPVNRSDESGTTENFTEYLAAAAGDAWPHEPSGDWPVPGGQAAQGTSGVVQTVTGGNGTIGYADASQAGDLGTVAVAVGDEFVPFSPEAAAAVVDASPLIDGRPEHDLAFDLRRDTTESGTYPIVLVSYLIVCRHYDDASTGELVRAYVSHVASPEGQQAAADAAGSAPISDELRAQVSAAIDAISVG